MQKIKLYLRYWAYTQYIFLYIMPHFMKNGKLITASVILVLLMIAVVGAFFFNSWKKITQYGYKLTGQTLGVISKSGSSVATGVIANPVSATALAYINQWNGDVKKEQKGTISPITGKIQFAEGDSLITGKDANAEIVFADNSIVRMNANSKLSFVKLASAGSEVRLNEGDIWARVLKPFYDTSFFTISTSDVSAGVQGTSVRIKKTITGTTSVAVIDSYSQTKGKEWVVLRYNNPKAKKESIYQILKPENEFIYTNSGHTTKIESFSGKVAFSDVFIRDNTKRDLIYMNKLVKEKGEDENLMKRLKWELSVTVPKTEEIAVFFDEPLLQKTILASKEMIVSTTSWSVDPTDFQISETFMDDIQKDISLTENRRKIADMKHQINTLSNNKEEKKKIEESLHEKEREIETSMEYIKEKQKHIESDNEDKRSTSSVSGDIHKEWTSINTAPLKQKEPKKAISNKKIQEKDKKTTSNESNKKLASNEEDEKDSRTDINSQKNFLEEVKSIISNEGGAEILIRSTTGSSEQRTQVIKEIRNIVSDNTEKIKVLFQSETGNSEQKDKILEEVKNVISKHKKSKERSESKSDDSDIIAPLIPVIPPPVDLKLEESSSVNSGGTSLWWGGVSNSSGWDTSSVSGISIPTTTTSEYKEERKREYTREWEREHDDD